MVAKFKLKTKETNEKSCCVLSKWSFVNRRITSCILADYCIPADYTCNPADYTCNLADYTCKLLNFQVYNSYSHNCAGHCGGNTPFFQKILPCPVIQQITHVIQWITLVKYLISGLQLLFCGSNGYCNMSDSGGSNVHVGLHM